MCETDGRVERLERELADARQKIEELELRLSENHAERPAAGFPAREEMFSCAFRKNLVPMSISTLQEGRYVDVNDAFLEIVGRTREEVLGNTSIGLGFITKEQREILLREIRERGRADNMELPAMTRGGQVRYGLFNTARISMGHEDYLLAVITDITKRVHAEKTLGRSEALLRGIAENLPGAVYQFHAASAGEMGLSYISARAFDLLGLENDLEKFFPQFVACVVPEERDAFLDSIRETVRSFSSWDHEVRFIKPTTGEELFIRGISQPRRTDDGIVFDGVLLDVTAQKRAEIALRESEARFRDLVENTSDWIWELDREMRTTYSSPRSLELLGYTPEELSGMRPVDFMLPDGAGNALEMYAELTRNPKPFSNIKQRYRRKDGTNCTAEISGVPIHDMSGAFVGFRGIARDIAEREAAEEALRQSEARYRLLAEKSYDIVWTVDRDFTFTYMSPSVEKVLGHEPQDRIGKGSTTLMSPESAEKALATFVTELRRDREPGVDPDRSVLAELEMIHKNGSRVYVEVHSSFVRDPAGNVIGAHGVTRDITARKIAEERLHFSEKKFSAAFHSSPAPMGISDLEQGRIIDVNQAFVTWSGYAREELIGRTAMEAGMWPREWSRELLKKALLKHGAVDSVEIVFQTRHGDRRNVLYSSRLIDLDGKPHVLSHSHDITDRVRATEELKRQHDRMESLVRERTADLRDAYERLRQENETRKATEVVLRAREQDLEQGRQELVELNAALKVLLRQRDEDKRTNEMNLMSNLNLSVFPSIEKLEESPLGDSQRTYLAIVKANLQEITSPFMRQISSEYMGFTPAEIRVASLIKEGRTSKEIARIMNISPSTVHTYRNKIRKKTNTRNSKVNLRSYLRSLG